MTLFIACCENCGAETDWDTDLDEVRPLCLDCYDAKPAEAQRRGQTQAQGDRMIGELIDWLEQTCGPEDVAGLRLLAVLERARGHAVAAQCHGCPIAEAQPDFGCGQCDLIYSLTDLLMDRIG